MSDPIVVALLILALVLLAVWLSLLAKPSRHVT